MVVGDPDPPAANDRGALRLGRATPQHPDLVPCGADGGQPALRARLVHDAALDRGAAVRLADAGLRDLAADAAQVSRVEQVSGAALAGREQHPARQQGRLGGAKVQVVRVVISPGGRGEDAGRRKPGDSAVTESLLSKLVPVSSPLPTLTYRVPSVPMTGPAVPQTAPSRVVGTT